MVAISSSDETGSRLRWSELADPALVPGILDVIAIEGMIDRAAIEPEVTLDTVGVEPIEVVMIVNRVEDTIEITIPSDLRLGDTANLAELVGVLGTAITRAPPELKA